MTREQVRTIEPGAGIWDLATGNGGTVMQVIKTLHEKTQIQVRWNLSNEREFFTASEAVDRLEFAFAASRQQVATTL